MTKFSKRVIWYAGTVALLMTMGAVAAEAQTAPKAAAAKPGEAKSAASGVEQLGLIDVKQSDVQQKLAKDNWIQYNGDETGRRYSGLTDVTPANVSKLGAKWIFHAQNGGSALEGTPVVVNGVMFVTAGNDAFALDAATGKQLWHFARPVTPGLVDDAASHHNRGVAVLGNRVYKFTDNAHLLCLDARSGNLIWERAYATDNKNYGSTSAPVIVKNMVMVSESGGDSGVRGFLAAFDAETGKEVWRFWTIPAPGEPGSESWPGDSWKHACGTTWVPGTYDPELNTIYWGTGNACPDYDGTVRPGDDLYTSSLLALDADTGKLKWYFQYTPHDLWDYDGVQTPVLIDTTFKGKPRKLVVTVNKNGFLYIIDRTNGKFLFAKPFIANLNWTSGLDANGRPQGPFLIPTDAGTTVCPTPGGASNWYSPSYDPATNNYYFRSGGGCTSYKRKPQEFKEGENYYATGTSRPPAGAPAGGGSYINAFNLGKLDFSWRDEQIGQGGGGAGVMTTAGGLAAFGNNALEFEIDDAHTGKPLWNFNLGAAMRASPMSYGINGKQYFAVAAGDDVIAFALP